MAQSDKTHRLHWKEVTSTKQAIVGQRRSKRVDVDTATEFRDPNLAVDSFGEWMKQTSSKPVLWLLWYFSSILGGHQSDSYQICVVLKKRSGACLRIRQKENHSALCTFSTPSQEERNWKCFGISPCRSNFKHTPTYHTPTLRGLQVRMNWLPCLPSRPHVYHLYRINFLRLSFPPDNLESKG